MNARAQLVKSTSWPNQRAKDKVVCDIKCGRGTDASLLFLVKFVFYINVFVYVYDN